MNDYLRMEEVSILKQHRFVLDSITFHLSRGQGVLISGENGSGKTTLLRSILGFEKLSSGSILLNGEEPSRFLRRGGRISYVPQDSHKGNFPVSVEEILRFSGHRTQKEAQRALARFNGDALFFKNYNTLSGGEKQKVQLTRCLLEDACLILLDEPSHFLDQNSKNELKNIILELKEEGNRTILLTSHNKDWGKGLKWDSKILCGGKLC